MSLKNVNLRELEIFRETLSAGSATRAAERLGVSQPAVSRALAKLEKRMGFNLFDRIDGRLVPAASAHALDEELAPVFSALQNISHLSENSAVTEPEVLRVVAPPTFTICLIQPLISSFIEAHPDTRFSLDICSSTEAIQKIATGQADIGMCGTNLTHEGIHFETIMGTDAVCVMPSDHVLTRKQQIEPKDLDELPFIAISRSMSSRYSLERILDKSGVHPRIIAEVTTSYTACQFIDDGLGVGIVNPFPVMDGNFNNLAARPFVPSINIQVQLMTPANIQLGWLAQAFSTHVRKQSVEQFQRISKEFNLTT